MWISGLTLRTVQAKQGGPVTQSESFGVGGKGAPRRGRGAGFGGRSGQKRKAAARPGVLCREGPGFVVKGTLLLPGESV